MSDLTPEDLAEGRRLLQDIAFYPGDEAPKQWLFDHADALLTAAEQVPVLETLVFERSNEMERLAERLEKAEAALRELAPRFADHEWTPEGFTCYCKRPSYEHPSPATLEKLKEVTT